MSFRDAALLLLGHGSTLNADSSAPTYQHVEEIRRRQLFAEVQVGFWKEEPNFRQALRQTGCSRVYVVPNFISSGYFTEQVIPRELGLAGAVTRRGGQEVIYCEPVGLHPEMTEALLRKAQEAVSHSRESIARPDETACLFICGHGTSLNDNSTKIIHEQAEAIRSLGRYADCQAVLMEQSPFVKEWRTLTDRPDVIVVPFFIADGLHSFEDIPGLLGLPRGTAGESFPNPHHEGARRLWYASAIGTEKFLADVIIAQVRQAEKRYTTASREREPLPSAIEDALGQFLGQAPAPWKIGQVVIQGQFELRHESDGEADAGALRVLASLEDLRDLIRLDGENRFRPLRAAPNLRRGWIYHAPDVAELQLALDYLYPAELANWRLWKDEQLPITPWRETAERQTGRFRVVREAGTEMVCDLVAEICARGCLKRRLWSPANEPVGQSPNELPLLCPEACNFLVEKVRKKLKGGGEE